MGRKPTQLLILMVDVPGKVLFFGGFSVLEMKHPALSLAVRGEKGGLLAEAKPGTRRIRSPQFRLDFEPAPTSKELVAYPYLVAECYLKARGLWRNEAAITLKNGPMFGKPGEKTGLGSSAAACVAVVKAVYGVQGLGAEKNADEIHKLAQYAYACFAKKVGSGFDIATCAAAKSMVYERYDPSALTLPKSMKPDDLKPALEESMKANWRGLRREPFMLPSKYGLLFFNIRSGKTSTISSVKTVGEYKKRAPAAYARCIEEQRVAEEKAIEALGRGNDEALRVHTHQARAAHRKLQEQVTKAMPGAELDPIEPAPLQKLIDVAEEMPSVVAGRCPGAGGWDGVAFIVLAQDASGLAAKIGAVGKKMGLALSHIPLRVL